MQTLTLSTAATALSALPMGDLVSVFNTFIAGPDVDQVKKFSDRETAVKRIEKNLATKGCTIKFEGNVISLERADDKTSPTGKAITFNGQDVRTLGNEGGDGDKTVEQRRDERNENLDASGVKAATAIEQAHDEGKAAKREAQAPAGRKKPQSTDGKKFFKLPLGSDGVKTGRPGTNREKVRAALCDKGLNFEAVMKLTGWTERQAYEGVRLIHYAYGYRIWTDEDGVIHASDKAK